MFKAGSQNSAIKILWAVLLISLPFTSFPLVSKAFNGTHVAPLAAIPLIILVFSFWLPMTIKQKRLAIETVPLVVFTLISLLSIGLSFYLRIPSFRNNQSWMSSLEGMLTLLMGLCFYLVTLTMHDVGVKLEQSLRWINIGGLLVLFVCLLQAFSFIVLNYYPDFLYWFQSIATANGMLYRERVSGVALEPSWLAHQLNMLYLPLWLAFSVRKESIYKYRFFKGFTLENMLLIGGMIALFLSFSRIGWITTFGMLAYLVFRWVDQQIDGQIEKRIATRGTPLSDHRKRILRIAIWLGVIIILVALAILAVVVMSKLDRRMLKVFDVERLRRYGILGWASQLEFAERIVYWLAGLSVFFQYPMLGVGLGNSGYFFIQFLNPFAYRLPESIRVMFNYSAVPNPKNLWSRLLAETGILGFAVFLAWVLSAWGKATILDKGSEKSIRTSLGLAGKLFVIAMVFEGFSMDTFGLPYYWIAFGLLDSALRNNKRGFAQASTVAAQKAKIADTKSTSELAA